MGIIFAESAGKHGIPRADALHAVTNADAIDDVPGLPGEPTEVSLVTHIRRLTATSK